MAELNGITPFLEIEWECEMEPLMQLTVNEQIQKMIEKRIQSGQYKSAEDVVAAAISQLDQQDQLGNFAAGELDQLVAEGEQSGESLDGEKVLAELRDMRARKQ